jgi:tetratricopeptide (TPR) repeat protein
MKNKYTKVLLLVVCIYVPSLLAQPFASQGGNSTIDSLIVQGKNHTETGYLTWDKDLMMQGYSLLQQADTISPNDKFVKYYLAYIGYRIMTYGMAMKDDKIYSDFSEWAEKRAKDLIETYKDWAEPKALLASIYGIEIAHNWMKSIFLGSKSMDLANNALSIDSTNPRAYLVIGIAKSNTPSLFGGNNDVSVQYLNKSIMYFERERLQNDSLKININPDWGYEDALTWLGIVYEKQKNYSDALAIYEKALQIYPNYARAKYALIPEVREILAQADKK